MFSPHGRVGLRELNDLYRLLALRPTMLEEYPDPLVLKTAQPCCDCGSLLVLGVGHLCVCVKTISLHVISLRKMQILLMKHHRYAKKQGTKDFPTPADRTLISRPARFYKGISTGIVTVELGRRRYKIMPF